jgi:ABC-type branched-subunit amino acid transport system ATPase component
VSDVVLRTTDLVAGYDGQAVLHGVDLEVSSGEIVSLLGANGAGKSTLLKTIMGTVPVIKGHIDFKGDTITRWPPHKRIGGGIGFSPEGRRVFPNMTVEENLLMGAISRSKKNERDGMALVLELFPILRDRTTQRAGTLSGGEQQMLAIGRAFMSMPSLLLVEEPSQGLAPVIVDRVYEALRSIADGRVGSAPVAVVVAEQFQQVHEDVSDRILVIDKGSVISDDELTGGRR